MTGNCVCACEPTSVKRSIARRFSKKIQSIHLYPLIAYRALEVRPDRHEPLIAMNLRNSEIILNVRLRSSGTNINTSLTLELKVNVKQLPGLYTPYSEALTPRSR